MYKENLFNIRDVLDDFNNVKYTVRNSRYKKKEITKSTLYITITKGQDSLSFDIYRKPTTTHVITSSGSCNSKEPKSAAVRYYYNRITTFTNPCKATKRKKLDKPNLVNKK